MDRRSRGLDLGGIMQCGLQGASRVSVGQGAPPVCQAAPAEAVELPHSLMGAGQAGGAQGHRVQELDEMLAARALGDRRGEC